MEAVLTLGVLTNSHVVRGVEGVGQCCCWVMAAVGPPVQPGRSQLPVAVASTGYSSKPAFAAVLHFVVGHQQLV